MTGPSVSIRRRVAWIDTDAAGIWHHSVIIRWFEEAEAELHRELGVIGETFGRTPRVKTSFEFFRPVKFDDVVDITLRVVSLGTTSITYEVEVTADGVPVASGSLTAVLIDRESGEKKPWSDRLRKALQPEG